MSWCAAQVRAGLASLGLRSLDELIGRADLLRQRDMALAKTTGLDLSFITTYAGPVEPSSTRIAQCAPVPPNLFAAGAFCWNDHR
jgi:glutamate synthase (ferredoxin)